VLGLTLADWRALGQQERARATNKGSRGERVKEIWWSADTAQLLCDYINHERRHCDLQGRGLDELPDSAPLFVTEAGAPYRYKAFYANWQKTCARIPIRLTPHQVRHWYVTMALRFIATLPDDHKQAAYRQSLIAYIGWRNPETIKAYDHHLHHLDFAPVHAALVRLGDSLPLASDAPHADSEARSQGRAGRRQSVNVVSPELENYLSQVFGWEGGKAT
jgi:integrase